VLVDYRVASVARTGMRCTLGAGGSAVVAVVAVGVGGWWVSIRRAALSQPAPRSRTQGGSCGCSPRGAAATVQIGHHRQSVPAAAASAGLGQPGLQPGFDALQQRLGEHPRFGAQLIHRLTWLFAPRAHHHAPPSTAAVTACAVRRITASGRCFAACPSPLGPGFPPGRRRSVARSPRSSSRWRPSAPRSLVPRTQFPRRRALAPALASYDGAAYLDQGVEMMLTGLQTHFPLTPTPR